jgi:hypothetical protein
VPRLLAMHRPLGERAMHSCEGCQNLLLDYLYDLLEGIERQEVQAHLQTCPACQIALAKVQKQQDLLAAAAKMEFPAVQFVRPAGEPIAPMRLPLPKPAPVKVRPWRRVMAAAAVWLAAVGFTQWLVSAAVMMVLFAIVGSIAWFASDYAVAQHAVNQRNTEFTQLTQQAKDAQAHRAELGRDFTRKIHDIENDFQQKRLLVYVTGPATVQPGATNTYEITATDLNHAPADANISVQLMSGDNKLSDPIAAKPVEAGRYMVSLPADLPVTRGSHLAFVVNAEREKGPPAILREELDLAATPVYLTHLTTDKPMYLAGEVVHFRALTLDRATFKPADEDLRFLYEITSPLGEKKALLSASNAVALADDSGNLKLATGPDQKPIRGVSAGELYLDENAAGGEYTLTLREERNRFAAQERKFIVNRYKKSQLNKELDYSRKTYGPGDEVIARCKVTNTQNAPLKNIPVLATVQIDGKTYDGKGKESPAQVHFKTDNEGAANVRFKLPQEIETGRASLTVTFNDGANVDSLVRPIPLVLKKLKVEFFPEGGELVAGFKNRVYFQVLTPLEKPADIKGRLLEDGTPQSIELQTLNDEKEPGVNQGMGVFAFTPKAKHKYEVQVDSPVGITQRFELPEVKDDGVVLTIDEGVVGPEKPIPVKVHSTTPRSFVVGAYCRGQLLDTARLEKGQTEATLKPAAAASGVCRVTVFEEQEGKGPGRRSVKPVAERLIYRQPAEKVTLAVRPDQSSYQPVQKVKLTLEAASEKDEPAPAIVMVSVVDKRVITMADEKTARSMPTHFLLTSEVRRPEDLEYADFLLGPQEKARQALDLLLGTQGWRRFAEQDPVKFRQEHKDQAEADRLLCLFGQSQAQTTDFVQQEIQKAQQSYLAEVTRAEETQTKALEQRQASVADAGYVAALAKLAKYRAFFHNVNRWIFPGLGVLLLGLTVACLLLGLRRGVRRPSPYFVTAAASAVVLMVGTGIYLSNPLPDQPMAARNQEAQFAQLSAPSVAAARGDKEKDLEVPMMDAPVPADNLDKMNEAKDPAKLAVGNDNGQGLFGGPVPPPAGLPGGGANLPLAGIADGALAPGAKEKAPARPTEPQNAADLALLLRENMDPKVPNNKAEAEREMDRNFAYYKHLAGLNQLRDAEALRKVTEEAKKADAKFMDLRRDKRLMPPAMPVAPVMPAAGGFAKPDRGAGKDDFRDRRALEQAELPALPPVVVREYAHRRATPASSELRQDFAETLYWHPVLVLPNGKQEVSFDLCDSVTTYQVTAFAHTLDGRLGSATQTFDARLPFTLEPKVPVEVTSSDKIDIPLSIANNGSAKEKVRVQVGGQEGLSLLGGKSDAEFDVPAGSAVRKVYRFQPSLKEGHASLTFAGKAGAFADTTKNSFTVVPEGFPVVGSVSDLLETTATQTVTLPNTWVKGTLKAQVSVYPSTLADLQKGLDSLLREPNGCFEQTSTANYPNLLILDYLKESDQAKPEIERRARDLLSRGYQKLTSFECTNPAKNGKEGYEWFGGTAPAHEALTAYGLLEFRDMSRVQDVDPQMLERTRQYLLSQRDGKGGFKRNPRAIDTFGRAPEDITNAYIVWALTEGGKDDDVTVELSALNKQAQTSKDPYFLSLVANSLLNRDQTGDAVQLLKKVANAQKDDGHLDAERTSITGSGGRDLQIETTALGVLGWLKANRPGDFNVPVQKAVKWIGQQRGGYGGFGSTQSTILALKALIAYARANKKTPSPGELKLYVGNREVSKLAFPAGVSEALTLTVPDAEEVLKPGANKVRIDVTGKNAFPYTLTWTYSTLQPVSAENCPVRLTTKLARTEVTEGDGVRLTVQVENKSGKGQSMAVAIVGLPGGLTVPEDLKQLKEYTQKPADGDRPLVSAFEIRGRELILYWRDLAPDQKIEVPVDLICRVPGEYNGPASRAYLYYNSDLKHWVEPLKLTISAK